MNSRKKAILACGMVAILFSALFSLYGYNNTWQLWNIPTKSPHFADLRPITHGAESYKQGLDPMIENPGDPWQRRMNYPRIWQSLYFLGINHSHTTLLGVIFIFSFLIGICLILPNANKKTIAMVFAAVLSPAILLGVERGNIDLLVFFFAALSVIAIQRSYILSVSLIMAGFLAKLFPIFGCAILFKAERPKLLLYMLVILAISILYAYINLPDLLLIKDGTPRSTSLSYGMNVVWMKVSAYNNMLGLYARFLSYLFIMLIIFISFSALLSHKEPSIINHDTGYLDSFRVGAAIYVGTFLLGNNWDYRLMFLLFVIPQLILWSKQSNDRIAVISNLVLLSIYSSLWYLLISKLFGYFPYGNYVSFVLDEICNWIAFSGLMYLFFLSLPIWVREVAQKMYPLTIHTFFLNHGI